MTGGRCGPGVMLGPFASAGASRGPMWDWRLGQPGSVGRVIHAENAIDFVPAQGPFGGRGGDDEFAVELDLIEDERVLEAGVRRTHHWRTTFSDDTTDRGTPARRGPGTGNRITNWRRNYQSTA